MAKKPKGFRAFDRLARTLAQVPPQELGIQAQTKKPLSQKSADALAMVIRAATSAAATLRADRAELQRDNLRCDAARLREE